MRAEAVPRPLGRRHSPQRLDELLAAHRHARAALPMPDESSTRTLGPTATTIGMTQPASYRAASRGELPIVRVGLVVWSRVRSFGDSSA